MFGQINLFDILPKQGTVKVDVFSQAFEIFHDSCKHRGWLKPATETEEATWMCGFAGRQLARSWNDWIPCNEENCPLRKEHNDE